MTLAQAQVALALLLAHAAGTFAQTPTPSTSSTPAPRAAPSPYLNHSLVFLDPAHGGDDLGAHLDARTSEADATLALAVRLRALLTAGNLNVLLAREPDPTPSPDAGSPTPPPPMPTPDQRAGAANHVHPFACILLHATAAGSGVHVVTSALHPADPSPETDLVPHGPPPIPWSSAQRAALLQSDHLAAELNTALARAGLPTHRSRASVRPMDSLTCPAVAIELAPLNNTSAADPGYQQRVAQAIATALLFWRGQTTPPPAAPSGDQP